MIQTLVMVISYSYIRHSYLYSFVTGIIFFVCLTFFFFFLPPHYLKVPQEQLTKDIKVTIMNEAKINSNITEYHIVNE